MPSYDRVEAVRDEGNNKTVTSLNNRQALMAKILIVAGGVILSGVAFSMLIVLIVSRFTGNKIVGKVEIQGHRGCRGILPENSIPGFLKAIDNGVDVIEMDTVISQDNKVVMSHEPWLSPDYCTGPNGENITSEHEAIEKYAIYHMPYSTIAKSNCGHLNHKFPMQTPFPIAKALLADVIDSVEKYIQHNNKRLVQYNIETKSKPERDGTLNPPIRQFCELLYQVIKSKGITSRVVIQSFDMRSLQIFRELDPSIQLSLLVEQVDTDYVKMVTNLGFLPHVYSPHYKLVKPDLVKYFKQRNVRVIPWTVNVYDEMMDVVSLGVDGFITDYPNLARSFMMYPGSN